ncbi:MAG: hypothetical protein IJS28_06465 [Synergistaceae bacterium]|nr:hypothetical protein [Synergistaceae bacterium]
MITYPTKFLELLHSVKAKRPRTVIQHILKHGYVTTEELRDIYGYNHPPRAIRDVREYGIPIITYRVTGTDGRSIAAYKFGNPEDAAPSPAKSAGRTAHSKALKQALIDKYGAKCFIYLESMDEAMLQTDHRIPYEIGGEREDENIDSYMLLSPSANRAKSRICEHCENWDVKDIAFCSKCFWAHPENYEHIAGRYEKVIILVFTGDELDDYRKLISLQNEEGIQNFIKKILHERLSQQ